MLVEKSIISEKLKKVKGLASAKIGDAQGVLIANGAIRARDKVMSVELKMPEAEGTSFVLPVKAIDYINSLPEGAVEITEEADSDATISPTVLNFESDKIDIAVKTSSADFNESVRCEGSVEPLTIGCNARYICDALKYCSDKKVTISAASSKHPIFVCDSSAEMLILPVMLKNKTD